MSRFKKLKRFFLFTGVFLTGFSMSTSNIIIESERLRLRQWEDKDLPFFIAMNKDPEVMHFLPKQLTAEESIAVMERLKRDIDENGFGRFACALKDTDECIGFVGLSKPNIEAHFTPCVEICWRLRSEYHGKGYATEAARAVLKFGFEKAGLDEIVSFTTLMHMASRNVMEKIGMTRNPADDFMHPRLAPDHWLSKHVLYRISKKQWQEDNR
jgi:RimJ/RimL family protein N-acetyltransferase